MEIPSGWVICDGCGLPASPDHIAERLGRLEFATRFRPVHINVLFVAHAPQTRPQDDFYRPPESPEFFDAFMDAVEIPVFGTETDVGTGQLDRAAARLGEFQRRGYYLSYLSECPIVRSDNAASIAIARLGPTLIRRVRFNYKPKRVVLLGNDLSPLLDLLNEAGMSSSLVHLIETPDAGDAVSAARFRATLPTLCTS
jgi:hypothetical protein